MSTNPFLIVLVVMIFGQLWTLIGQRRMRQLAESTHIIVNSQRSMMLRAIALLSRRIAEENPKDKKAQAAALAAEQESVLAEKPRR